MSETIKATAAPERPHLLAGFLTRKQLDAEMGWAWRTRVRREAEGLPVVKIGGIKLYPIDKVRAWILNQVRERTPARGRGRPRKAA